MLDYRRPRAYLILCMVGGGTEVVSEDDKIGALRAKHADLEAKLEDELRRPVPNEVALSEIKRLKLRIKDQISQLESH